jgi:hypothetical protein
MPIPHVRFSRRSPQASSASTTVNSSMSQADGGKRNLVELAAVSRRPKTRLRSPILCPRKRRSRSSPERTTPISWRRSRRSRQPLVPTFFSMPSSRPGKEPYLPSWIAGTHPPKFSKWPPRTMAS